MIGFVYCLANMAMPGLYKIGHTTHSPHQRAQELSRGTGVPHEFTVVGYIEIENPQWWEQRFHAYLDPFRSNDRREFFKCGIDVIAGLFLFNQHCMAKWDGNFAPELYPMLVKDLPDPYEEIGYWVQLGGLPQRRATA